MPSSFQLVPKQAEPTDLRIVCLNRRCEFTRDRPLPILAIDEPRPSVAVLYDYHGGQVRGHAVGRRLKVVMLRVYLVRLAAAQRAYSTLGGKKNADNSADPYMTVLGYFNSLRELGGTRRVVEDEVCSQVRWRGERKRVGEAEGLPIARTHVPCQCLQK